MNEIVLKLGATEETLVQEAYKVLRTNLQFCGDEVKVIAVTSTKENEGKTTVSLNIAKSFAELGKKVLFLDADMRKSVIVGRHTNSRNLNGLSEILSGMKTFSECVCTCQIPRLDLVLSGRYPPNPAELLNSKRLNLLLEESRKYYDYIIIDTPPLGRVIDAAVIAPNCDGVALVIGGRKIPRREVRAALEQVKKSGCRVLGVIWNKVSLRNGKSYSYKKYA